MRQSRSCNSPSCRLHRVAQPSQDDPSLQELDAALAVLVLQPGVAGQSHAACWACSRLVNAKVPGDEVHCKRPGDEVHCKRPMRSKEERTHTPLPLGCAPCPPRARALLLTQSRARAPSVRASSMVIAPLAARSRRAPRPLSSVGEPDMPGALDSCIEAGRPERWAASLGLPRRGAGWLVLDLGVIGAWPNRKSRAGSFSKCTCYTSIHRVRAVGMWLWHVRLRRRNA